MSNRESNCIKTGCYGCWRWWMAQYEPYPPAASPTFISSQPGIPPNMQIPRAVATSDYSPEPRDVPVALNMESRPTAESAIKDIQEPFPPPVAGPPGRRAPASSIDRVAPAVAAAPNTTPTNLVGSAGMSAAVHLPTSDSGRSDHEVAFLNSEAGRKFVQFAGGKVMPV